MSGLQITTTTAGRAALVNAQNLGTAPMLVTQIGITDQVIAPDEGMTVLPGELKRLITFAGAAVADDTIHVTIRDDSADVYSLRGFALYLEDGTLFAVYGQSDVILEKSALAMMLLATDIRFVAIDATSLTFGDTNWINPPATTTVPGVVELTTDAEAIAGADSTRALTAAAAKAMTDNRFGVGAPSAFFKPLLALATAALMRTALELGNAATRNEGAGNNLDADKLDGQHGAYYLAWANLTGKPVSFTPTAHSHPWSEVSGAPSTATRWPVWNEVSDKPVSFAPSAHTHAAADINSGVFAVARIPVLPEVMYKANGEVVVGQKTFAPGGGGFASLSSNFHSIIIGDRPQADGRAVLLLNPLAVQGGMGLMFDSTTNEFRVSDWGSAGAPVRLALARDGSSLKLGANAVWHAGNFDPGTKANLVGGNTWSGSQIFSEVNAGQLILRHASTMGIFNQTPLGVDLGGAVSTDQSTVLWATGPQGVFLRPVGRTSTVGQMALAQNGNATFAGSVTAPGGFQGSSRKLKNIDGPMPYGLAELLRIETAIGSYKPEYYDDGGRKRLFVIAEQLAGIVGEPVSNKGVEFGGELVPTVDYMQLVPLLIRSVQELEAQVRRLRGPATVR